MFSLWNNEGTFKSKQLKTVRIVELLISSEEAVSNLNLHEEFNQFREYTITVPIFILTGSQYLLKFWLAVELLL